MEDDQTLLQFYESKLRANDTALDRHAILANAGGLIASMSFATALASSGQPTLVVTPCLALFLVGLIAAAAHPYLEGRIILAAGYNSLDKTVSDAFNTGVGSPELGTYYPQFWLSLDGIYWLMKQARRTAACCFVLAALYGTVMIAFHRPLTPTAG